MKNLSNIQISYPSAFLPVLKATNYSTIADALGHKQYALSPQ